MFARLRWCPKCRHELVALTLVPPLLFWHRTNESIAPGAADTVYAGETYRIRIRFPANYPIEAPEVVFVPVSLDVYDIYDTSHL
ncbi:unnamed protein product, partial [Ectocarpus sp. 12 AP-2014]